MDKVVITKYMQGLCYMQVCVEKSATDEEILGVCNSQNPSGTKGGWLNVIHNDEQYPESNPAQCDDDCGRIHYLIEC